MTEASIHHSVIVPTSGRPEPLKRCLSALAGADDPGWEWEVLVVDNSSRDFAANNADVVARLRHPRFSYIQLAPLGLTAARHHGVAHSRGELVSFLDDDSLVRESWLAGVREAFVDRDVALVGGPNLPVYEAAPPAWLHEFWYPSEVGRILSYLSLIEGVSEARPMRTTHAFGCNMSIRKEVFVAAGGAHPDAMPPALARLQGDGETALSVRVQALGYSGLFWPRCAIGHLVPASRMTLEHFCRRAFKWGVEASFTALRAAHGLGAREGVPPWALTEGPPEKPQSPASSADDSSASHVRRRANEAWQQGWDFHRAQVESDRLLLEYVLRPNYLGDDAWTMAR